MLPREKIRIKGRRKLWGRARAVFRKFGICRICFRNLASDGVIPGGQEGKLVSAPARILYVDLDEGSTGLAPLTIGALVQSSR